MNEKNTTELGNAAERVAEDFFVRKGYVVLARNFRCARGEIDLVLWKAGELRVVEVKGRRHFNSDEAWGPRWRAKKKKLRSALAWYLAGCPGLEAEETVLEIVYVTQGRVSERYDCEGFFG